MSEEAPEMVTPQEEVEEGEMTPVAIETVKEAVTETQQAATEEPIPTRHSPRQEKLATLSSCSPDQPTGQSIRRILREWNEITTNRNPYWTANPVSPDEPYEWHFTIRGPSGTAFESGVYHGRLVLPITYPMTPPALYFVTPNGRFEVHKQVCLSATNFHPECWQPAWGIRSILDALHAFFPTPAEGAVHSLDWPDHTRRQLAETSTRFVCPVCQKSNQEIVAERCAPPSSAPPPAPPSSSPKKEVPSHPPSAPPPPVEPKQTLSPEERLEEIRRRRTPQMSRQDDLARHKTFLQGMPSFVVFLYYLCFFLGRLALGVVVKLCWGLVGTPSSRGRQIVPLHMILVGAAFVALGFGILTLLQFLRRVLSETFFLFDVPLRQTFQATTNPSADQIRPLSNAERFEDFPLHRWVKALFDAVWAV